MKKFFVGQLPVEPVLFKIVDERKLPRRVLNYRTVQVIWRRPDGSIYSDGHAVTISNPFDGVAYEFGATSPFTQAGEYQIQIKLTEDDPAGERCDYTDVIALDVFESLEGE
ncbi:hypothetical protein GS433_18885 [Rhodococcus hoagii]|uniref:hypothetical protein n=1 Tax=Rhodococcus hoagii TaxID=43767 RepID=UPI0007CD7484|nr:hypothetical protein [Prescottella equi]MBM4536459.1 hypothetical protein [Prescottella equi]NKR85486.1 hypothetical protein [Prescottella equi]ORJ95011.1 hypothetical protein A6F56_18960 [Prescottella equi]ORL06741.1 hypothetical protein A6I84_17300 [Prescottella equi]ORL73778.1 hypothetical protein A5N75_17900 [Prescottella equi]